MTTVASGTELKDIAQEFLYLFEDITEIALRFKGISQTIQSEASKETFYDGGARADLVKSMLAIETHFDTLGEYYRHIYAYTTYAYNAMMDLDRVLAEQIGMLEAPRELNAEMSGKGSRAEYLAKQEKKAQVDDFVTGRRYE